MGLLDGIMGNASELKPSEVEDEMKEILIDKEKIQNAYILIRDLFVFTNKRFILVDKQGVTGKKVQYHSIPYSKISHFSIETAGFLDLDAELKIFLTGQAVPIQKKFNKKLSIYKVQQVLAKHMLG
ncbi:MAG: PH domain-containing protein [Nanobdellota archaeon]